MYLVVQLLHNLQSRRGLYLKNNNPNVLIILIHHMLSVIHFKQYKHCCYGKNVTLYIITYLSIFIKMPLFFYYFPIK